MSVRDLELEEMCDVNLSEDELFDSFCVYEVYMKEDNNVSSDFVSNFDDYDDIELALE